MASKGERRLQPDSPLAFWSGQVAQIVGGIIDELGASGSLGQMVWQLDTVQTAPPTSQRKIVETSAGDLNTSLALQRMGARITAAEPDANVSPASSN